MFSFVLALLSALWLLGLSRAAEESKPLEVKAGDTAALLSNVSSTCEPNHVVWYVNNKTLVLFDKEEEDQWKPLDRYKDLDRMTGSLNIPNIRPEESGLYTGEITCRNDSVFQVQYNVMVVGELRPVALRNNVLEATPARKSPVQTPDSRQHWIVAGCGCFFLCFLFGLIIKARLEKKKPGLHFPNDIV